MSFALDDYGAAMGADVRQTTNRSFVIRCEDERLVEASFQECERRNTPGCLYTR
jgi:hypothetical protein